MQILPENKKRAAVYLVIFLLAVGASGYLLLANRPPPTPLLLTGTGVSSSQLLPFGSKLDLAVLQSEKFQALVASPDLSVRPEELGKTDLFR